MPQDPRKRQQKLERRKAKRSEKRQVVVREQTLGLAERMAAATRYPPLHCWVTEDFWAQGIGWVLLSRRIPSGIAVAVFLVDRFCLGVKNAMAAVVDGATYESRFVSKMHRQFTSRTLTPAATRKLVESAVAYARELGFAPHPDYRKAQMLFGDIDAGACPDEFEFGKDGKPFFISGPNDTPARCKQIAATLAQNCGVGNFDYLVTLAPEEAGRLRLSDDADGASRLPAPEERLP